MQEVPFVKSMYEAARNVYREVMVDIQASCALVIP